MDTRIQLIHGIFLTIGSYHDVIARIVNIIEQKKQCILLPCSLNDIASCVSDYYRNLYTKINILTTDGMPLVWYAKYIKKQKNTQRVYGPDLMIFLLKNSLIRSMPHLFIGPSIITNQHLKKRLKQLEILPKTSVFIQAPNPCTRNDWEYFRKKLTTLKDQSICWIGLSSPLQVELAVYLQSYRKNTAFFCMGAAFDIVSGIKNRAPVWMQKYGLEWAFRLLQEPKRLSKRYGLDIPLSLIKLFFFGKRYF